MYASDATYYHFANIAATDISMPMRPLLSRFGACRCAATLALPYAMLTDILFDADLLMPLIDTPLRFAAETLYTAYIKNATHARADCRCRRYADDATPS